MTEQNVEQRLEQVNKTLDEYENKFCVEFFVEDDISKEGRRLLSITPKQLGALSSIECGEAAYVLGQVSFRIQKAVNREQSTMVWAVESINKIIAKTVNNYKGYSFEERRMQAVRDNDSASKLEDIRVKTKLRIERLSFLSSKVDNLSKILMGLQNGKRGN